jgi:hypothetical protein
LATSDFAHGEVGDGLLIAASEHPREHERGDDGKLVHVSFLL